ncbi:hypothetical protein GLOIN_2v381825 [Rhizophagus irregularis DAOM 181602=DAOM 197198]|uniref:Uncharacterized protein n=1 Tax=Rhizophagus irregularis (strain DAOM 181602 / DAOM 197198 / MUCL 43194) TaxID=747089 RepID=A0A2P4QZJ1_RHIID|nr:hypothetical protein GLOIN_2v381825 [Rhizophagus irregularis DAOM 181602=DAOM 197198]POG82978.1 hypothetical protein GLOIN_2v381825 [Rhizophagus irregularis DAOM 181602=DAOM 197198]|eukprot:XP_025189844.1 hypothetical protein GLOIN_2v381825 [Rhizophagus irregularis DAOM 181602=DAOM 197198]
MVFFIFFLTSVFLSVFILRPLFFRFVCEFMCGWCVCLFPQIFFNFFFFFFQFFIIIK